MAKNWIFVTGTGTEVGKTYYASKLAEMCRSEGNRVGVYKPVASGCRRDANGELISEDAVRLWESAGKPGTPNDVCPQRFEASLAPPEAAIIEGKTIDEAKLFDGMSFFESKFETVIVEGAGGLFSPISKTMLNVDFAKELRQSHATDIVLVASNRLGVQHEVIASVRAAKSCGLEVDRVVLNAIQRDESTGTNAECLAGWIDIPIEQI